MCTGDACTGPEDIASDGEQELCEQPAAVHVGDSRVLPGAAQAEQAEPVLRGGRLPGRHLGLGAMSGEPRYRCQPRDQPVLPQRPDGAGSSLAPHRLELFCFFFVFREVAGGPADQID